MAEKDSGQIKSIEEFRTKLKALTTNLLAQKIQPTLSAIQVVVGDIISSEVWDDIVDKIDDDLETLFTELNTLDDVIEAHSKLLLDVVAKTLHYAISRLESQILLYEYLAKSPDGFDSCVFNTFRDEDAVPISYDSTTQQFIVDPRASAENAEIDNLARVDEVGERLTLGLASLGLVQCISATHLTNTTTTNSEVDVDIIGSDINNILDGQTNTYWIKPLLLSAPHEDGAYLEILLTLAGEQDCNCIEIFPASDLPMTLVSISQVKDGSQREVIMGTETTISSMTKIYFRQVCTRYLVLRFRQSTYRETQFKKGNEGKNFYLAVQGNNFSALDLTDVAEDIRQAISSPFVTSTILALPEDTAEYVKYYQYVFGFDNIIPRYETFNTVGAFLSKKLTVTAPGQLGLKVLERQSIQSGLTRSIVDYDYHSPDTSFHQGTVEYWLVSQFYGAGGVRLKTEIVPILPLGATRVVHEQLVFSKKSDVSLPYPNRASTMFYCLADTGDVVVYKNGEILPVTSWSFVTGDPDVTVDSPNQGSRMKRGIQVTRDNLLDIFTISYTPVISNVNSIPPVGESLVNLIDLSGDQDIFLCRNNIIRFNQFMQSQLVQYAECYLLVLLRNNTARPDTTPMVEEYMLLTGSYNAQKYVAS